MSSKPVQRPSSQPCRYVGSRAALVLAVAAACCGVTDADTPADSSRLTAALKHGLHERAAAAAALGKLGPKAADAIPALIAALKTPRGDRTDSAVAGALGRIGKAAVPALRAVLKDKDREVRRLAVLALGEAGPEAAAAVDALEKVLRTDLDLHVARCAVRALARLGPKAEFALSGALSEEELRPAAIEAMVRSGAMVGLVEKMTRDLGSSDYYQRSFTARRLGEIGPDARAALPALLGLAQRDPNEFVRDEAHKALRRIDPARAAGR